MRSKSLVALATVLLSTTNALEADIPAPTEASTGSRLDDLIPSATPFPTAHLDIRQNLGQDLPGEVSAAPAQVPPVTVYSILSQVGDTAKPMIYTYTQIFIKVPDQFPLAKQGQIGMGGHKKREEKRDAMPVAVNTVAQPLVLQMETVMVTQDVQRITEILVMEKWTINVQNHTTNTSHATETLSRAVSATVGSATYGPHSTASMR